ncbi:uncharacterized protein TRIVIDRAFT_33902 [Trichoderma virens Gv29-8]|uniref:Peptidase S8/S53 domain-containing protein n=1 Tax=Hypocrea virens (strain Gv29-8 / FGSC 10586) TaxID=413071 RepID=G9MFA6_HYPVG|nr:uncharacterized protein TRIVIDRAFT_33902 [Trichoderma virens Gv29-8]EHK27072.1 hypothetical protein TRIVIDRAFT_33902 [Trichoderma virens Gv29-8]UKZ57527.1 hypothetical protein TrVGV298_011385 [Trichoderma virens]
MAWFKKLALLLITVSPCVTAYPFNKTGRRLALNLDALEPEAKYIVTLQKDLTPTQFKNHIAKVNGTYYRSSQDNKQSSPSGLERTYAIGGYRAYSGTFDKDTIASLWSDAVVAEIELDDYFTVQKLVTQRHAPWGLAALSSKKPGSESYRYDKSAGNGTFAYVIDTGINTKHVEFGGRASVGYSVIADDFSDNSGHGTHVSGIIGGKTFGVAKQTEIIGVKVFLNNGGENSDVIDGLQWAVRDILAKGRQSRSVINMSLGGPYSYALNHAVDAAFEMGILVVVAAGNDAEPARYSSPASSSQALTVGAIDIQWRRCGFSNFGPEVNIEAPGEDIESAFIATDNATAILDGTSMATPHITGLALYLAALEKTKTAKELRDKVLEVAIKDKAKDLTLETPNLIAHNGAR